MNRYLNAPIYKGKIQVEVIKPTNYKCFNGAWYYKALSSRDEWLGIEAIITLPEFNPDEERFDFIKDNIYEQDIKRYKDTPSVYVGLSSDYENDVGFAWQRGIVNGEVAAEKITFRPFWRYIYSIDGEEKNVYEGSSLYQTEFYYFPGDKLKLSLINIKDNYLKLIIKLLEPTAIKKYQTIRNSLDKLPKDLETKEFIAPGAGIRFAEVKRVNAIDQYSNEGKPTQCTNAIVGECIWEDVYLYRKINGIIMRVPFTNNRYIKMLCPTKEAFLIKEMDNKEIVVISPKGK